MQDAVVAGLEQLLPAMKLLPGRSLAQQLDSGLYHILDEALPIIAANTRMA